MRMQTAILLLTVSMAWAGDWPQWRGALHNGTSDETGPVDALDPNSLLWRVPLDGQSAATPVVAAGRLYLLTSSKDGKEVAGLCFDAARGNRLWIKTLTETGQRFGQGNTSASCSPCVDDSGVVFLCGDGTLVKFDTAGEQLWKRSLADDYGPLSVKFGYSASPLLLEGRLYIPMLRYPTQKDISGLDSYLLCVDGATGQTVFKQPRLTDAVAESTNAYTSAVPVTIDGKTQIVIYGGDYITGHDPADGAERWRAQYSTAKGSVDRLIPSPVAGAGRLFCCFPRGTKTFAIDLDKAAAGADPLLWENQEAESADVPCPVLYRGALYVVNDRKKTLTCLDPAAGAVHWTGQLDASDMYYATPTAADGKLYLVNRKGIVTVVAADRKQFRVLSTHDFGGRPADSTLAVANGRLYLRTAETLYCFGKR